MSWDAALFGHITVPAHAREAWLERLVDWQAVVGWEQWRVVVHDKRVRELLAVELPEDPLVFLELSWRDDRLEVAGFMSRDEFLELALPLLPAFAAAASLGGEGELTAMGMLTASFGYRLSVGEGRAGLVEVPRGEIAALDEHPTAQAIQARVLATMDELFGEVC
jgi:hypothetical protein